MDFATIATKICTRVTRPDLIDDAKDAVNDALEFATVNGEFAEDLVESFLAIDTSAATGSIVISTTMPNFRKVKYLRPTGYNKYLTWKDPSKMFDEHLRSAQDVYYRAGDNLVYKLSCLGAASIYYGYYTFPARLIEDTDTHWMLDKMYSVIFNLAAADMWESVGNQAEATRYMQKGNSLLMSHRRDHQDGVAHA